jgi:hypothetical protein
MYYDSSWKVKSSLNNCLDRCPNCGKTVEELLMSYNAEDRWPMSTGEKVEAICFGFIFMGIGAVLVWGIGLIVYHSIK